MKKLLCILIAALGLTLGTTVATVTPIYSHVQVAEAAPVAQSAPVVAPAVAQTNLAGGIGIKPAAYYTSCYWAINGGYYCWRYGCTYFERFYLKCDTYVLMSIWRA